MYLWIWLLICFYILDFSSHTSKCSLLNVMFSYIHVQMQTKVLRKLFVSVFVSILSQRYLQAVTAYLLTWNVVSLKQYHENEMYWFVCWVLRSIWYLLYIYFNIYTQIKPLEDGFCTCIVFLFFFEQFWNRFYYKDDSITWGWITFTVQRCISIAVH